MDPVTPSDLAPRLAAWRESMADLAFASAFATADGAIDHLRTLVDLLTTHPRGGPRLDWTEIDRLIAARADASAALTLLEPLAGYMLSRAPGGRHLATVVLADQAQEHHAEGASVSLALVGALATALAGSVVAVQGPEAGARPGAEQRLN